MKAGRILQKLDYVIDAVENLKDSVKEHDKEITDIKFKIADIENRMATA